MFADINLPSAIAIANQPSSRQVNHLRCFDIQQLPKDIPKKFNPHFQQQMHSAHFQAPAPLPMLLPSQNFGVSQVVTDLIVHPPGWSDRLCQWLCPGRASSVLQSAIQGQQLGCCAKYCPAWCCCNRNTAVTGSQVEFTTVANPLNVQPNQSMILSQTRPMLGQQMGSIARQSIIMQQSGLMQNSMAYSGQPPIPPASMASIVAGITNQTMPGNTHESMMRHSHTRPMGNQMDHAMANLMKAIT